MTVEVFST